MLARQILWRNCAALERGFTTSSRVRSGTLPASHQALLAVHVEEGDPEMAQIVEKVRYTIGPHYHVSRRSKG
ncbi:hypothetical protein BGX38DRAFT_1156501 [Terfezia claveryi]|nr:hypothetical protein BGX38DRAFT_1156501 [Terfezia claveryi]